MGLSPRFLNLDFATVGQALTTGSWDLGQISSTMESTQSSARRPSRLTYKEASGMAATLSMLEDIGALHAALKISAENDKDQLL